MPQTIKLSFASSYYNTIVLVDINCWLLLLLYMCKLLLLICPLHSTTQLSSFILATCYLLLATRNTLYFNTTLFLEKYTVFVVAARAAALPGRSEIAILPRLKLISQSSIEKFRLKRGLNLCLTKFRSRVKFKRKISGDMGNQNRKLKIPSNLEIYQSVSQKKIQKIQKHGGLNLVVLVASSF